MTTAQFTSEVNVSTIAGNDVAESALIDYNVNVARSGAGHLTGPPGPVDARDLVAVSAKTRPMICRLRAWRHRGAAGAASAVTGWWWKPGRRAGRRSCPRPLALAVEITAQLCQGPARRAGVTARRCSFPDGSTHRTCAGDAVWAAVGGERRRTTPRSRHRQLAPGTFGSGPAPGLSRINLDI